VACCASGGAGDGAGAGAKAFGGGTVCCVGDGGGDCCVSCLGRGVSAFGFFSGLSFGVSTAGLLADLAAAGVSFGLSTAGGLNSTLSSFTFT
jgi:hypothetical protein